MSDLIKRSDAIEAYADIYWIDDRLNLAYREELDQIDEKIRNIPTVEIADRPQGEWIFHYRDKWMVKAECPKCHRRFEFSPRGIWKRCPMCETRMKGVSNEADSDKSK